MIEASFASQYGIRLYKEDLAYPEYRRLFNGLMDTTPLGKIISIRSEKDKDVLKRFGPNEKKIRNDWIKFKHKKQLDNMTEQEKIKQIKEFQNTMKQVFLRKGESKK